MYSRLGRHAFGTAIIFDADDTLWDTQPLYTRAKEQFFEEMTKAGFVHEDIKRQFEAIDHSNVSKLGFSKRRFPQSMYDTYRSFCVQFNRPFDEAEARRVQSIGATVFNMPPQVLEGVSETLGQLRSRGVRLILATKGDREVQEQRITSCGLAHYFERIYILAHKGKREFEEIIDESSVSASAGWSVGNSVKSDINPALAVGLNAIWIPYTTWGYEEEEPVDSSRLYKAASIREVPGIVLAKA